MPSPKDPQKLEEYREKMRRIALERGYGKWMKGKKARPESIEKMREVQRNIGNHPDERQRRSDRAKANGSGKWMRGRSPSNEIRIRIGAWSRGRTYEEMYGADRAQEERRQRRETNRSIGILRRKPHVRPKHNGNWQYREWRRAVFERDNYTCQICNRRGGLLNAHHIRAWAICEELRYEVTNGITYCFKCHWKVHRE